MGSHKEIVEKFRKARKSIGLTQLQVADMAEIDTNYYAQIERGEKSPSLETLKELMKILKIKSLKITA